MKARFASQLEIKEWNKNILSNIDGGNITQSIELANLKQKTGWKSKFIVINSCYITIQERTIIGLGKFWYIPKGPGVKTVSELTDLLPLLKEIAIDNDVFLIKIEPEIIKNQTNLSNIEKLNILSSKPIQPNHSTVILTIQKDLDKMMSELPQKSRHAINRAYRDGIKTKLVEPNEKNFDIMSDLIGQTMADKSVLIRTSEYYKNFWNTFVDNKMGVLFFSYSDNVPVAGAFVLTYGDKATYKDGGSIRKKTAYGASHALQWHIIKWLHEQGIKEYDLCGTPPLSEIGNDKHPHYGIGLFKTSFNKTVTEYVGLYDIPIKTNAYKIWRLFAERVVYNYYSKVLKKLFY